MWQFIKNIPLFGCRPVSEPHSSTFRIDPGLQNEILHVQPQATRALILSDDVIHVGAQPAQNMRLLVKHDLLPKWGVRVGQDKISFSDFFRFNQDYIATLGAVEAAGIKALRLFYFTKSGVTARLLPAINKTMFMGQSPKTGMLFPAPWDKVVYEVGLEPCAEVQLALLGKLRVDLRAERVRTVGSVPVELFEGVTRVNQNGADYFYYAADAKMFPLRREVEIRSLVGQLLEPEENKLHFRKAAKVDYEIQSNSPDFSRQVAQLEIETSLYGKLQLLVFGSFDQQVQHMYFLDESGRLLLGPKTDASVGMSSFGVPKVALYARELATPGCEYREQAPPGCTQGCPGDADYVYTWPYVRELPEIERAYRTAKILKNIEFQ